MEEKPRAPADEADPVARVQAHIDQHYKARGRRKPRNVVDSFLRERRREAKRELEEYLSSTRAKP